MGTGTGLTDRHDVGAATLGRVTRRVLDQFDDLWSDMPEACSVTASVARIHCRSDVPGYAANVARTLANTGHPSDPDIRLLVIDCDRDGRPGFCWTDRHFNERAIEAATYEQPLRVHYYSPKRFWQIYDRANRIGIQFSHGAEGLPDWDSGSPLRNFLHWGLGSGDTGLIHAGTLAHGKSGVILAGAGGSGKSGTVLSGVMRGLMTVGDDYVLADFRGGLKLRPLFRSMKQDPGGLARIGIEPAQGRTNWQNKVQFLIDDLNSEAFVDEITPRAILLPRISGDGRSRISPGSAQQAFLALAPSGVSQIHGDRRSTVALAGRVARSLPCWHLSLGTDPAEVTRTIRRFLTDGAP